MMNDEEGKTGRFIVRQAWRPGLSEMHKEYARRQAVQELGWQLGQCLQDGREYCVHCCIAGWEVEGEVLGPYEVLLIRVDVTLFSWRQAEVGEVAKDLAHKVRSGDEFHTEEGRIFQRMPYGWLRTA